MRAVAVEGDNALPAVRRKVCKHRHQRCRKALTLLRHDTAAAPANCASSLTSDAGHMMATFTPAGMRQCQSVVQKAAIELGDGF